VVASTTYALGSAREGSADGDVPPLFEVAYNRGKLVEPRLSARGGCVSSEDVRDDQGTHECIMPIRAPFTAESV